MPVRTGVWGQTLGHDQPPAGYRIFLLNFARPDGDLPRICARNISAPRGDTRRAFTEMGHFEAQLGPAASVGGCATRFRAAFDMTVGYDDHHEERAHAVRSRGAHRIGRARHLPE